MEGTAWFLKRDIDEDKVQPFTDDGTINTCQTKQETIRPTPVDLGGIVYNNSNSHGGFAATASLHSYFCDSTSLENDNTIRQKLREFWQSPEGVILLQARFADGRDLKVFPTHVTRRTAPPDHLSLVHIDYPSTHGLQDLYREWNSRWKDMLPHDMCTHFRLKGVLTVWMALGQEVSNYPLCIAELKTSPSLIPYNVGEKKSVGVHFDEHMRWYVCPRMKPSDAWIFDTQHTPHCSVDFGGDGSRVSIEVRCLIVIAEDG